MYNKLLIETGGGIIDDSQMAKQANAATVNIGLGGTGIDCLKELKKQIHDNICPDNGVKALIPEYKHIKFLAVDTDSTSLDDSTSIYTIKKDNEEFFDISCGELGKLVEAISEHKEQYPEYSWLCTQDVNNDKEGIKKVDATDGAGGIRQAGRLLIIEKSSEFRKRIKELIEDARIDLQDAPVNINIFTGVSGGTGAGTFLDICYIIRYVISNDITITAPVRVNGFFFLPDVNLSKKDVGYVPANGYAALKELNYCMDFENNGDRWSQLYKGGFSVNTNEKPVDMAYLISATDSNGNIKNNGYQYAMNVAVDCVFEFITKPFIPTGAQDGQNGNVFTVKSHISNFESHVSEVKKNHKEHGGSYNYCVLGGSKYYLPYKDIMTYLASKIFTEFSFAKTKFPLENDIKSFLKNNQLTYEDIYNTLRKTDSSIITYAVDNKDLKDAVVSLDDNYNIPSCYKKVDESLSAVIGEYKKNLMSLSKDIEKTNTNNPEQIISLITKIDTIVKNIATDQLYGPYYAIAFLHSVNNTALVDVIDGYIKQNDTEKSKAIATLNANVESLEKAKHEVEKDKFLGFGESKSLKEYSQWFYTWENQRAKVDSLEIMDTLLHTLKSQINNLYNTYYQKLINIFVELDDTFTTNLIKLNRDVDDNNTYAKRIVKISDPNLKKALDDTVEKMDKGKILSSFVQNMFKNDEKWLGGDPNSISNIVANFFLTELHTFVTNSITYYLMLEYDIDSDDPDASAKLQNEINNRIIKNAYNFSNPLFPVNSNIFKINYAEKMGYCSVPQISTEIKAAANQIRTIDRDISTRLVEEGSRISIFQYLCGVPLSSYAPLQQYYSNYIQDTRAGKHLYEGEDNGKDKRDFRELPEVIPFSSMPDNMRINLKDASDEYDYAVDNGIITYETVNSDSNTVVKSCKIHFFDENKINEDIEKIQRIINSGNINSEKLKEFDIKNTVLKVQDPNNSDNLIDKTKSIINDGCVNHQDVVCKDNALSNQYICSLIKEQNELFKKYNSAIEELQQFIKSNDPQIYKKFAQALCCNVIFNESHFNYKYKTETGVFAEDIELTTINTEPYGRDMPLYSAFYNYKALPNDIKDEIDNAVNEVLNNNDTYVNVYKANKESIKKFVLEQGKEDMDAARKLYANNAKEIQTALEQIYNLI